MSFACALAWNIESLTAIRALQGFLGGAMIPTVFAANFKIFPPQRQMVGTIVIGLTATVAPSIGPTLGGLITELLSWHWLFLVNLVPGPIVTFTLPSIFDLDRSNWPLVRRADVVGIVQIAGFLGSLKLALNEDSREDWFSSLAIMGFRVRSAPPGIVLLWRDLAIEEPVLGLKALTNRNFTMGCLLTFVVGMCLYGQSLIWPPVLRGVGPIMGVVSLRLAAIGTLPPHPVSGGSGLFNHFRNRGVAVGSATINTQRDGATAGIADS